jgi:hypothetical protein
MVCAAQYFRFEHFGAVHCRSLNLLQVRPVVVGAPTLDSMILPAPGSDQGTVSKRGLLDHREVGWHTSDPELNFSQILLR